ncbi:MAG: radical SAM protein [Deltaproteobacteria bacterium]|nr:radical SAM protein [Deltaproteobacteria bacterium]
MKRLVYNYAKRLVSPSSGPTNLTFFVTGACAFQCKTCFYWHHLNEADNELTLDEIERLAPSLAGCSWIALTGGEPLQRRDFGGVLEAVMRKARPPYLTLVTNGFHPKRLEESLRNALPFLDGGVLRVSVSLDGVGALHDEIRGVPGSLSARSKVCACCTRSAERTPDFR